MMVPQFGIVELKLILAGAHLKHFLYSGIKPEVAWENLNDRPGIFLGQVDIENEEQLNSAEDTKEENSMIMESEMQLPAITGTLNKPDLSKNTSSQKHSNQYPKLRNRDGYD